jgi:glycosyltransferase involved in cell wall biosynthesis
MLSICINVKNGESGLSSCLSALTKFDDVVLLDNYSTDNSLQIAQKFSNVRIYQCDFQGMGKVRNLVASYAKYDWVFFVDCDEVLSSELVNNLLTYPWQNGNIYQIYRYNYYHGKLVTSSSWENDLVRRIYNRRETSYSEVEVHESVISNNLNILTLDGWIYHFPYQNVEQLISKMQLYSNWYAKQYHGKKKPKLWLIPFRMLFMFIKCYILKRGFKDGYEGLTISMFNAIGVWSKYIKLYELDYHQSFAIGLKINSHLQLEQFIQNFNQQITLSEAVIILIKPELFDVQLQNLFHQLIVSNQYLFLQEKLEITSLLIQNCNNSQSYDKIIYCHNLDNFKDKNYINKLRKGLYKKTNLKEIDIITKQ